MKYIVAILLLCGAAFGQAPVLFYSDLPTGMCTGGENNRGHWVTIVGNNFGAAQDATHYVKLGTVTQDTYSYWTNTKIAFQLGTGSGCQAAGDYNITVVTPSGTSNTLPMHIYTGGAIYFFSNSGNDSTGDGSFANPFQTSAKCHALLSVGTGKTCYFKLGYWDKTGDVAGYLDLRDVVGSSTAWNAALGYPTTDSAQVPKFSCPDMSSGCTLIYGGALSYGVYSFRSAYLAIGNIRTYYYIADAATSGGSPDCFHLGGSATNTIYSWHHVRASNIECSGNGVTTAMDAVNGSFLQLYGWNLHDINNNYESKHTGGFYIGTNVHDYEVGWSTADASCAVAGTCHTNKGLELHSTKQLINMPPPILGALSATSGGSLAAGTYTVQVSYRSRAYYGSWVPDPANCYNLATCNSQATETAISNAQTITVGANSQITVPAPAGYDSNPGWGYTGTQSGTSIPGDGVTTLCNPALAFRVFACVGASCTPTLQGESAYSTPTGPQTSTASNFTLSSLTTTTPYQTPAALGSATSPGQLQSTDMTGCNMYNGTVHDSKFINWPGYSIALAGLGTNKGTQSMLTFYNNEIVNSGNNGSWIQGADDLPYGYSTAITSLDPYYDTDGRDAAEAGTVAFVNNTFYNSGKPYSVGQGQAGSSIISPVWAFSGYPTRTFSFINNVIVQPQSGQNWWDSGATQPTTNLVLSGNNNLCYGFSGANCSSPNFNSGGSGQNQPPNFTAAGTPTSAASGDSAGGIYYAGYNVKPAAGSAAIDNGVTTSSYGVTNGIDGVIRPQNFIYDIGNYEFFTGTVGMSVSGATIKGAVIR